MRDWQTDNLSPLEILRNWLGVNKSKKGKGLLPYFTTEEDGDHLTIREAEVVNNCSPPPVSQNSTNKMYIVNGGYESRVISFEPQIKWHFGGKVDTGGFIPFGSSKALSQIVPGIEPCPPAAGTLEGPGKEAKEGPTTSHSPIDEELLKIYGPDAGKVKAKTDKINLASQPIWNPITATMRIQGDPDLDTIGSLIGKYVTVIFLNPFKPSLVPKASGAILDWTLQTIGTDPSTCNGVLSSKKWMIQGISHDISEGSYTTTLRLYLIPG